mmetsp:Transcript_9638/g.20457  ORF Transcript_9638/g.20457 Transcript_9638/m.20457 type:complete len:236 (+) Transcript_9638:204-911(+)
MRSKSSWSPSRCWILFCFWRSCRSRASRSPGCSCSSTACVSLRTSSIVFMMPCLTRRNSTGATLTTRFMRPSFMRPLSRSCTPLKARCTVKRSELRVFMIWQSSLNRSILKGVLCQRASWSASTPNLTASAKFVEMLLDAVITGCTGRSMRKPPKVSIMLSTAPKRDFLAMTDAISRLSNMSTAVTIPKAIATDLKLWNAKSTAAALSIVSSHGCARALPPKIARRSPMKPNSEE